jgi:hypothetical protein
MDGILSMDLPRRRAMAVSTSLPPALGADCTFIALGFGGGGGGGGGSIFVCGILGALHIVEPAFDLSF